MILNCFYSFFDDLLTYTYGALISQLIPNKN